MRGAGACRAGRRRTGGGAGVCGADVPDAHRPRRRRGRASSRRPPRRRSTAKLEALEDKTTDQFVVATVKSLQGYDIQDYGYQLGRAWGIGQKDKNNGVILLVAPNERKVGFEVGYGLEGTLTDALTQVIIQNAILPRFRANDMAGGIARGVDDAIQVLSGDAAEIQKLAEKRPADNGFWNSLLPILFFFIVIHRASARFAAAAAAGCSARCSGRASGVVGPFVMGRRRIVVGRRVSGGGVLGRRRVVRRRRIVGELVKMADAASADRRARAHPRRGRGGRGEDRPARSSRSSRRSSDDYRFIPLLWATLVALMSSRLLREFTIKIGLALGVRGLFNIQFAIKDEVVYVLEVNPRASRTVPSSAQQRRPGIRWRATRRRSRLIR